MIDQLLNILPADRILRQSPAHREVISGESRSISGTLYPITEEEITAIIQTARTTKTPIHPVSTGRNWGLGSDLPPHDGGWILNLSKMSKIHHIDVNAGFAIIEPGVTQWQLHQALLAINAPWHLNVTGAGAHTSIVGNAMDRGTGYVSMRCDDILAIRAVLGTGHIIDTGVEPCVAHTSPLPGHTIPGPQLNHLFTQSSFGIVTRVCLRLLRNMPSNLVVVAGLEHEKNLSAFIDTLAELRRTDTFRSVFHIGNRNRALVSLAPRLAYHLTTHGRSLEQAKPEAQKILDSQLHNVWTCIGSLHGYPLETHLAAFSLRRKLSRFGQVRIFSKPKIKLAVRTFQFASRMVPSFAPLAAMSQTMQEVLALPLGMPSSVALHGVRGDAGYHTSDTNASDPLAFDDLDNGTQGIRFILPTIPLSGRDAEALRTACTHIFEPYGFEAFTTMNIVSNYIMYCVINIAFDRTNQDEIQRARQCSQDATRAFLKLGFIPDRMSIDDMHLAKDMRSTELQQTLESLKSALDPDHIISPGRYGIL